ncbi:MAG: hypothetical protein QXL15_01340, partial [Candidatus Korarchaeota archaeon]
TSLFLKNIREWERFKANDITLLMKIYTVFVGKPQWEAGWPYLGFDNDALIKNILKRLGEKFREITFIGGEMIVKFDENLINTIKNKLKDVDGLIVYTIGQYGDEGPVDAAIELVRYGLPTILANYIYGGDTYFIRIYERVKGLRVLAISSLGFDELEWAVNILFRVLKLRGKKVLNYTLSQDIRNPSGLIELLKHESIAETEEEVKQFVAAMGFERIEDFAKNSYIDLTGIDQAHQWRRDEERYRKNLQEIFGIEMVVRDPHEITDEYNKVEEKNADEIARKWIENASAVSVPREIIRKEARLFLALKRLLEKYNADAITVDCGTLLIAGFLPAYPCAAMCELMNMGAKGGPESDMDSLISALLLWYITGRPAYISNHCFDLKNQRVIYLHCCGPSQLYGPNGPTQRYEIAPHGESHFIGASIGLLDYPEGESVTTIKVSILERKIAVRSGRILGATKDEKACHSKLIVETNARKILDNYDFKTFGWHRVTVLGNWREKIIAAARLLGLKIVEEDV